MNAAITRRSAKYTKSSNAYYVLGVISLPEIH